MPKVEETKETEATSGRMTSSTIMGWVWDGLGLDLVRVRVNSVRVGLNFIRFGVNSVRMRASSVGLGLNLARKAVNSDSLG